MNPASEVPGSALKENLRTFRIAAWLGWQLESNWADPIVFLIFAILRPLSSALILVVMYQVIAGGQQQPFFDYLYISNAFFVLVLNAMSGMSWAILDDRENYKMLKYIFTSPARRLAYLFGRAVAKLAAGMLTTIVLLATGVLVLGLGLDVSTIEWGWLFIYFVLGLIILAGLGLVMAGVSLVVARNGGSIGEIVGGSLLLFSGALFPVDILPTPLKEVGLFMPVTYWLEGMRRALKGGILTTSDPSGASHPISPIMAQYDNWQLLLILSLCAAVCFLGSLWVYNWVEHQARERGMIDRVTGY